MLSCSIWFSAPSFWIGGGLESRYVGHVYGANGAVHHPHRKHDLRSGSQEHHPSIHERLQAKAPALACSPETTPA